MYKTRPGPEFPLFFWPGPVRPGPVSDFFGPARFDPDRFGPLAITAQYCTGQYSSKTQKKLEFQTIFEKVTLEPLKKIWDLYQSIRLEKSVSKMGFLHLICWTNDHFIKKHWNFDEIFDFRGCRFFEIFENLDFWRFDPMILCSCLWRLRKTTLESHNSKQMAVYEQKTCFYKKSIFSNFFVWPQNRFLIKKRTISQRIPRIYVEGHTA